MSPNPRFHRIAAWLIRGSCRRLPENMRAERYLEWSAELHAILDDRSVRPGLPRAARALRYAAGTWLAAGQLRPPRGAGHATAPPWRDGAMRARPVKLGARATVGVISWLAVVFAAVALVRVFPGQPGWPFAIIMPLAVGFDAFCLVDIARADEVRYLPKWAWVLICLVQTPGGGIAYLSLGRAGKARPAAPGPARS